jgi:pyruvate, water dikinase
MKVASAIVTERGGRTCHAAIVARELGVPAVVGADGATKALKTGSQVIVSCADGEVGKVCEGRLAFEVNRVAASETRHMRTAIMLNLGNPELTFHTAMLPNQGVGLARMEFIISEHIGVHPMALVDLSQVKSPKVRAAITNLTRHYARPADFFVERLAEGIGTIAGAFHPKPVIVRLSDFKTNEYASLVGGADFEPKEANPMLGFRGAARYAYAAEFALECAALVRVRDAMGLKNVRVLVPFCRRVEEARGVIAAMERNGLNQDEEALEIYVMCENSQQRDPDRCLRAIVRRLFRRVQ